MFFNLLSIVLGSPCYFWTLAAVTMAVVYLGHYTVDVALFSEVWTRLGLQPLRIQSAIRALKGAKKLFGVL